MNTLDLPHDNFAVYGEDRATRDWARTEAAG